MLRLASRSSQITLAALFILHLAGCKSVDFAPPQGYALILDPQGRGWQHPSSGFVFPPTVANFERQTVHAGASASEIGVDYRLTSSMNAGLLVFVNMRVSLFEQKDGNLATTLQRRAPREQGVRAIASGTIPGPGGAPGVFARYTAPAREVAGYNEDSERLIALFQRGGYCIEYRASYSQNRAETGSDAVKAFVRDFSWPR